MYIFKNADIVALRFVCCGRHGCTVESLLSLQVPLGCPLALEQKDTKSHIVTLLT